MATKGYAHLDSITGQVTSSELPVFVVGTLTGVFYVAKNGDDSSGNGSIGSPYLTIQKALDQVPAATNGTEMRRTFVIHVEPGTYDESLSIDIGRKKVLIYSEGAVHLGTFGGSNWAPTGTTRNITVTCSLTSIDSIRASFGIVVPARSNSYGTHQAYSNNFRISGTLNISNSTGGTSGELTLEGVTLFGWDGVAAGNNDSITAGSWAGNLNTYLEHVRCFGVISGGVVRLQKSVTCSFEKLITIATYSGIFNSEIKAGMTWSIAPTEVPPIGIFGSVLTGTFTGASSVNLLVDSVTDYHFSFNGCSLANSAVKIILQSPASVVRLSTTSGIDGTTIATTSLYTPTGFSGVVLGIVVRVTAASGVISVGSASVGQNAGVNDIIPITALTSLNAAGQGLPIDVVTPEAITPSGTPIQFKITTGYVATSITLAVDLIGYLI